MRIVNKHLIKRHGSRMTIEQNEDGADLGHSANGNGERIEERLPRKDGRYPLRGKPYRYDRPCDSVAVRDWEVQG